MLVDRKVLWVRCVAVAVAVAVRSLEPAVVVVLWMRAGPNLACAGVMKRLLSVAGLEGTALLGLA